MSGRVFMGAHSRGDAKRPSGATRRILRAYSSAGEVKLEFDRRFVCARLVFLSPLSRGLRLRCPGALGLLGASSDLAPGSSEPNLLTNCLPSCLFFLRRSATLEAMTAALSVRCEANRVEKTVQVLRTAFAFGAISDQHRGITIAALVRAQSLLRAPFSQRLRCPRAQSF